MGFSLKIISALALGIFVLAGCASSPDLGKFQNPIMGKHQVTSPFGQRSRGMHYGIDLGAKRGTPVHASASGRVIRAEYFSSFGNFIVIDHGNDITTRYAHLQNILVRDGARVVGGQPIGLVGSTGRATGPHLHFEILVKGRQKNPQNYVKFGRTRRLPSLPSSSPSLPSSPPPQWPDVIKGEPAPGLGTGLDTGSL